MDSQNAIRLLNDTFDNSYDEGRFLNFIRELFNGFDTSPKKHLVPDAHKEYIDSDNYKSLGEYKDDSGKLIDVLAIKLKKSTSRDRARTMQRNLVAKYLSENNKHAALVAFYGYDPDDWRFSFVKLDYRLEKDDSGKVKTVEDLTPAKRYSFLVGVYEPNHTCRSQFLGLIKEEDQNPSFEEIETAFSIEKVTKEFFEKYKGLFLKLKDALDDAIEKDPYLKEDFDDKDLSTVDFAKKLLGQIVFLYFLQKKGWLGVERDQKTRKFKEWGSGPKNFLKKLFDKEIVQYDNFFNDVLEPLFYEALAREHDGDYYSRFECKIPFLNGGLFEPINDYNWQETDILLDNAIFEKIIGTFNEFNFTVKEDEPLEKEVAVDPEMLGKVFENLLDVKDRKSKGAFYTPREIVHYMCQQSLINYLETNTKAKNIPREDFETFIQFGDYSSSADQRYLIEINKLLQDIRSGRSKNVVKSQAQLQDRISKLTLPNSIISNKELIDRLLADIKVVDPAVGSGAFPVGMMNEIVKARSILTIFWFDDAKADERTTYNIKRQTIQNCLYGVDLDSSAVDITKLRFWLSLIVDEDDMEHIQPLPNLDNKIMCGNSLLEEFEGVKLFDENMLGEPVIDHSFEIEQIDSKIVGLNQELNKIYTTGKTTDDGDLKQIKKTISKLENEKKNILSAPKEKTQQLNLNDADNFRIKQSQRKLRGLKALQKQFFDAQSKKEKTKLRDDIDNLEWELIEETLKEDGNEESIQKLNQYKKAKSKPFFLWKLYFAEVFQKENPGFDVVIANPPYVRVDDIALEYRGQYKINFESAYGKYDLYYLFFEKSFLICSDVGTCVFITPNKFCAADSAKILRRMLFQKSISGEIVSTSKLGVFESASNYPIISIIKRSSIENDFLIREAIDINFLNFSNSQKAYLATVDDLALFPDNVVPINVNQDSFDLTKNLFDFSKHLSDIFSISEGLRIPKKMESEKKQEFEIVKQYQFSKYSQISEGSYISEENFKTVVSEKSMRYKKIVQEKILIAEDALEINATIDLNQTIPQGGVYFGVSLVPNLDLKFILSLLNSKLYSFLYEILYSGMHMGGGYLRYRSKFLENLPITESVLNCTKNSQQLFINLVDQILAITKDVDYLENPDKQAKVKNLENQIDQLVYKLYDLTPEEIKIVEGFNEGK